MVWPGGSAPEVTVAVKGCTPPDAISGWSAERLVVSPVSEGELNTSGPPVTVMDSAWVTVAGGFSESVTETVKLEVPVAVAWPVISPSVCRASPVGSEPAVIA